MNLYEFFIGYRFLKAGRSGIISLNAALSAIIVCIGVFSMIVVVAVMNGFQSAVRDMILDMDSHISVSHRNEATILHYENLKNIIISIKGVESAYPSVDGMAILGLKKPVAVRGIGGNGRIPSSMEKFIVDGKQYRSESGLAEGGNEFTGGREIFIGVELAELFGFNPGDEIELIAARGMGDVRGNIQPVKEKFRIAGFFKTRNNELDSGLVVMSLKSAQDLYGIGDTVTSLRIITDDVYRSEKTAKKIDYVTDFKYRTRTTEEMNENLFYALRLEKLIMIIILFIVILSALIAIMGTLVMIVSEKKRSVGILKSMGSKSLSITTIFILEGFFIGSAGSISGTALGLAAAFKINEIITFIEKIINYLLIRICNVLNLIDYEPVSLIPKNIYYLDFIPVKINPGFVIILMIVTALLSSLAALLPSIYASKLHPIDAIRHE